jgi:hypothetical protein
MSVCALQDTNTFTDFLPISSLLGQVMETIFFFLRCVSNDNSEIQRYEQREPLSREGEGLR